MKPIDYVNEKSKDEISVEIKKLLTQEWSVSADLLMLKTSFKKIKRSSRTMLLNLSLMFFSFIMMQISVFPGITISGKN